MKKILLIAGCLVAGSLGVQAQGVIENMRLAGVVVMHVYSPDLTSPGTEFQGNVSLLYASSPTTSRMGDFPTGSQTYTGTPLGGATTGATSPADFANGTLWDFALYGAGGANVAAGSLQLCPGSLTTFNGTQASLAGSPLALATDPTVPGAAYGGQATIQARAWYNGGGLYTTYAAAVGANQLAGASAPINLTMAAASNFSDPNLTGLGSFSLVQSVPEPSTIALGVMGASAFLLRRRMSK